MSIYITQTKQHTTETTTTNKSINKAEMKHNKQTKNNNKKQLTKTTTINRKQTKIPPKGKTKQNKEQHTIKKHKQTQKQQ